MRPCLAPHNTHLLAFENPYYDVIAAMGLDDEIEEDYYNPLYDEMPMHSDSEAETDEMYTYEYRRRRERNYDDREYNGGHPFERRYENHEYEAQQFNSQYPYDKDSGFSSGTLM